MLARGVFGLVFGKELRVENRVWLFLHCKFLLWMILPHQRYVFESLKIIEKYPDKKNKKIILNYYIPI